jgi:NTE family protein
MWRHEIGPNVTNFQRIVRTVRTFSHDLLHRSDAQQCEIDAPVPPRKLGLALGGGFARGLCHIGVLKVLEQENIPVHCIAGTSVGAVIGAAYCSGVSAAELEEMASTIRVKDFARWVLSRYGFWDNDRMARLCRRVLKVRTFAELRIPLAITATDFRSGEAVVFTEGDLVDPIRASCAYPGMFRPVEFGGRSYIDGMLAHVLPAGPARQIGAEVVLGSYLNSHWADYRMPRHIFEVIGQCFSIAQSKLYDASKREADLIVEPDVAGFSYDAFASADELIERGEGAARQELPRILALLGFPEPVPLPPLEALPMTSIAS